MRVVNSDRPEIKGAERRVIEIVRSWDLPGIAVSGAKIGGVEIDLLLLSSTGDVVEVKGIRPEARGLSAPLRCGPNGDWHLAGFDGDPVHATNRNPVDQLCTALFAFKNRAEKILETGLYVSGRVVVVPWPGDVVVLDKGTEPMPEGCDVMLADPAALQNWFDGRTRRPAELTAQQVHTLLTTIGFGEQNRTEDMRVTYDELVAAGFPEEDLSETDTTAAGFGDGDDSDYSAGPVVNLGRPAPIVTGPALRPILLAHTQSATDFGYREARDAGTSYPPSRHTPPRQLVRDSGRPRQLGRAVAAAALFLGAAAGAGVVLPHMGSAHDPGEPRPVNSTIEPANPVPPSTSDAPALSLPWTPPPCYPLNPRC